MEVSLLKLLSSLALFPNHYLTICLNWPAMEMKADRFSAAATGRPNALRRALVKISVAYATRAHAPGLAEGVAGRVRRWLRVRYLSIRFFFGDGILGYVHPYLSERLDALGTREGS